MDSIGVGVVGCGFVGYGAHVAAFSSIQGARLVAVADADPGRLGKAAKKYQCKTYPDFKGLVDDPDVQAVVVAVPTPLHAKVALAAIAAGKHVLCEMPLAPTMKDAEAIVEAAAKKGVNLMPSLTFRFTPTFLKVKELIKKGAIGEPTALIYREFIPAKALASQWPASSWMWKIEESGGPLFTLAVWSIDLFRWLLETEVTKVGAAVKYTKLPEFGGTFGYDSSATLTMANGVAGSMQFSGTVGNSGSSNTLEVVGSAGHVIKANENESVTLFAADPIRTDWHVKEPGARMWGHVQQDEHWVQCLLKGQKPCISPDDGLKAEEVALKIAKPS